MQEATTLKMPIANTNNKIVMDVQNITKSLPLGRERIDILKGISFQIMSGEFVSIVGPSGSGKSTLLGIIAGLDNPTTGQVFIDGVDITRMTEGRTGLSSVCIASPSWNREKNMLIKRFTRPFRQLQGKLTLSYTLTSVVTFLLIEVTAIA